MGPEVVNQRIRIRDFDPDRFLTAIAGGAVEHFLVGPSPCSADLQHWSAGGVFIDRGAYDFGVLAQGNFRPDHVTLGMAAGFGSTVRINGFEVSPTDMQFYSEGSDVFYRADRHNRWMAVHFERARLLEAADARKVRLARLPSEGAVNLPTAPRAASHLVAVIESFLEESPGAEDPAGLAACLLDAVVETLATLPDTPDLTRRISRNEQQLSLVRQAQRALLLDPDRSYDSTALCSRLGVSERTLQLRFRQVVGMSPRRWLQRVRLHGARRELAASGGTRVTEVALRWGFDHLGRFGQSYRELFGMLPSQTGSVPGDVARPA